MSERANGRIEDRRLVTGHGRYCDDVEAEGALYAAFARSPYASARVSALDAAPARKLPGVVAVLTGRDLAADGIPPHAVPMKVEGPDGRQYRQTARPLLIEERVRYLGEPLALVVAESRHAAADGAEAVAVELEPLPAVADLAQAEAADAPLVWADAPANLAFHWRKGDWEEVGAALAASCHVARVASHVSRVAAAPMEPRCALVVPAAEGPTTLYASHQNAQALRQGVAAVLKLDVEAVHVVCPDVGGAFGMKSGPLREEIALVWAARRLGRPLRWTAERGEGFLSDEVGRDVHVVSELGLDRDGGFTALRVSMISNVGAYASGRSMTPIMNVGGIAGVYKTPLIAGEVIGRFTNSIPAGPYRGAGRPDATFAIEAAIDRAARDLGRDPLELRRQNLIPASAMPYQTPFLFAYDSGDFAQTMTLAAERADYAGFEQRRREAAARGKLRGIGIANPIEVAGGPFGNPGPDFARLTIAADGTVTLGSGVMSCGQGLETALLRLADEALGLPEEQLRFVQGDTEVVPEGKGMGGSAAMTTGGPAVVAAVEQALEKARALAADLLEAAPADLEYAAGRFTIAGTDRSLTLAQIAEAAEARGTALAGAGEFAPAVPTYPNGCHICEVEIDPETGQCQVVGYACVEDIGRVLYPQLAAGQVHGGVAQGLGQALMEAIRLDPDDAQVLSGSFLDYAMPRALDLPRYDCTFTEVPTAVNPLGVKGVGEAGTVGALAAGINAVRNALAAAGVEDFDMPATPDRIWRALRSVREAVA